MNHNRNEKIEKVNAGCLNVHRVYTLHLLIAQRMISNFQIQTVNGESGMDRKGKFFPYKHNPARIDSLAERKPLISHPIF